MQDASPMMQFEIKRHRCLPPPPNAPEASCSPLKSPLGYEIGSVSSSSVINQATHDPTSVQSPVAMLLRKYSSNVLEGVLFFHSAGSRFVHNDLQPSPDPGSRKKQSSSSPLSHVLGWLSPSRKLPGLATSSPIPPLGGNQYPASPRDYTTIGLRSVF